MKESVFSASAIYEEVKLAKENAKEASEAVNMVGKNIGAGSAAFKIVKRAQQHAEAELTKVLNKAYTLK
ncbi:hypothetical protein CPT_Mater72 [Bacillus phage Mater]|uniref:Uncharacterized protein n=1 Tax=Bacillus phage Mater TaxID=1540090 RepID=A0A0A0RNK9_9CAUD|nr:hypothetical protein CPT_Mater72 [Bacillus phage Mater]AIW03229.1 hypothetical protein CPT_Mater72 [Bacillus phage Mater]